MEPELPRNNGKPCKMEELVQEEGDNQNEETFQNPPDLTTGAEEKKHHAPHYVIGCWKDQKTEIYCKEAKPVEDLLKTSAQFRRFANKNPGKVLVIVRDGKPIAPHFPCMLIQERPLNVKYITDTPSGSSHTKNEGSSGEPVIFHVEKKGGPGVVKILKYPTIEKDYQEISVYGYKGETVIDALRRDGRFQDKVFKNCALSNINGGVRTELSNEVDNLDGKTFKIIQVCIESAPTEDMRRITRQMSAKSGLLNDNKPKDTPEQSRFVRPEKIPDSEEMLSQLSTQFKDFVDRKRKTPQFPLSSSDQDLLRVEYGKNLQTCMEVQMVKKLMVLSDSVCQVRINECPEGSGFLLFDKYVLTNGHVVKNIYDDNKRQHRGNITVHFSFESLGMKDSKVEVVEVAGFERCRDESGQMHDWALLKLHDDQNKALLTHCSFLPQNGGICIIGHPGGGVKKIDPCLTVQAEDRGEVVKRHHDANPVSVEVDPSHYDGQPGTIQMLSQRYFDGVAQSVADKGQILTYETCFYFGSSGSPVFDEYCKVVAMHSGGYIYRNAERKDQSVIEFGYPLSTIIEHIMVQLVQRGKFDVFKDWLACKVKERQSRMESLKLMVDVRNLSIFKEAAFSQKVTNDRVLKKFFDFICQSEEPVPMEH